MYMEGIAADELHRGLIVRTTNECILIWSPDHDLVRAPEIGLNWQWPIGTWVQYRAIDEGPLPNNTGDDALMVYEISRARSDNCFPEVNVRNGKQIELNIYVSGPIRHLNSKCVLANDHFLGPVLCESNYELVHKFTNDVQEPIELKVVFSEEFPDIARFVALEFRDESVKKWIELKNLTPDLMQTKEQLSFEKKALGTFVMPKLMGGGDDDDERKSHNQHKSFGTLSMPKKTNVDEEEVQAHNQTFGALSKPTAEITDKAVADCLPSTSNKIQMPDKQSNPSRVSTTSSLFSLDETVPNEVGFGNTSWSGKSNTESGEEEEGSAPESNLDREEKIIAELAYYQRDHFEKVERRKRSFGLIVEKMLDYAIVYSKKFGLAILLSSRFPSLQQFDSFCVLGQWLLTVIVEVPNSRGLTFAYMCLPPFEQADQRNIKTEVNGGRVKILLNCDFSITNLKPIEFGQYVLSTELGDVLVSETFIQRNGLFENVSNVWVCYTGSKSFFWEIEAEAKIEEDSEAEIVLIHNDNNPSCDSITNELASIDFTCDVVDPSCGVAAELASVFASDSVGNGNKTKNIEEDAGDGHKTENECNNCELTDTIVDCATDTASSNITCQAQAADMSQTAAVDQTLSEQQQQLANPENDFSSIYNYAKAFWARSCKEKMGEHQGSFETGEGIR